MPVSATTDRPVVETVPTQSPSQHTSGSYTHRSELLPPQHKGSSDFTSRRVHFLAGDPFATRSHSDLATLF